ncbi:MAG TPA: EutN/CcmL family microcompartment protein [Bacteroidota bacterium]|nr:EutN/CcmL family microcompartment protein [Bacteroidota bacterium]
MILCRVSGSVVATEKQETLRGRKILLVRPVTPGGAPAGDVFPALDDADAGTGDLVLVVRQGEAAAQILGRDDLPARAVVVAVVDGIDIPPS